MWRVSAASHSQPCHSVTAAGKLKMRKHSSSSSPAHSLPLLRHRSLWNLVPKKCAGPSQGGLRQPNHSGDFCSFFHLSSNSSNTKSHLELPVPSYGIRFHPELKIWKCVSVVDWFQETHNALLKNHLENCPQVWEEKPSPVRRGNSILDIPIPDLSIGINHLSSIFFMQEKPNIYSHNLFYTVSQTSCTTSITW